MNSESDSVIPQAPVAPSTPPARKKSKLLLAIIVLVALAIIGALITTFTGSNGDDASMGAIDPDTVVASVNGVDISRGELDKKIEQVRSTLGEGAPDPATDQAFELQLLDEVVNLKLLIATAESKGFTVSEEQIQKEIDALTQAFGGEVEFQKQLEANGLTGEELRTNMHNELLIRQLVDSETDIENVTVSSEEIASAYESVVAGTPEGQTPPTLEEMTEMIRAQLLQKKSADIVQEYINRLRAGAKIDILL